VINLNALDQRANDLSLRRPVGLGQTAAHLRGELLHLANHQP
jgi:hypothetical protein